MKKMLFACTLIMGGIIGMVGWTIACAQTVELGAKADVIQTINTPKEIIIFIIFIVMLISGLLYGIRLAKANEIK